MCALSAMCATGLRSGPKMVKSSRALIGVWTFCWYVSPFGVSTEKQYHLSTVRCCTKRSLASCSMILRVHPVRWSFRSKEQIGRNVENLGELFRLGFTNRALAADDLRGYAAGTKNVEQVALAQAVLFHQAAQPAVGR